MIGWGEAKRLNEREVYNLKFWWELRGAFMPARFPKKVQTQLHIYVSTYYSAKM
jgi:hypothetical protein